MKKTRYIIGLILATFLASCSSDEYEPWASPQSNAQETAKTISFSATAGSAIDFNSVTADSVQLFVPTLTTDDSITYQSLHATLYNADKSANYVLSANENGYVKASELQTAIQNLFGKSGDVHAVNTAVTDTIKLASNVGFVETAEVITNINLVTPDFGEFIYEIGNESGWATSHALRSPDLDGKYEGWYYLDGDFKFKPNKDNWDGDYEYNGEGKLTQDGSDNIPDPGAGFYKINVDLNSNTYSLTDVEYISIIGSVKGNWDTDVDMTYNVTDGAWEYTGELTSGDFKFRLNHDWTTSWGGKSSGADYDDLTTDNGNNLTLSESGTYTIKFYLTYEGNNKVVITKQ